MNARNGAVCACPGPPGYGGDLRSGCAGCKTGLTAKSGTCQFIHEHNQKIGHPCNGDNNCQSKWCLNNGGNLNARNGAVCGCIGQSHMGGGSPRWGGTYTCAQCNSGLKYVGGKCRRRVGGHCSNGDDSQCADDGKYGFGWCVRSESRCV